MRDRRDGAQRRPRPRPGLRPRLSRGGRGAAVRRLARSCATPRPSAATCCSARAAPTSTTPPAPATGASPAAAATRAAARTAPHAILGWSDACIATHPSDFCVPLVALDAVVEIEGPARPPRASPLEDFHRLPGDDARARDRAGAGRADRRRCACPPTPPAVRAHSRYLKLRERTSFAFALVSAAAGARPRRRPRSAEARHRARRRRGQAVARPRGRGGCWPAPRRAATPSRRAAEAALADAAAVRRQRLQDRARRAGSSSRALPLAAAGTPERMPALPASAFAPPPEPRPCLTRPHPARRPRPARLEQRPADDPPRRRPQGHRRRDLRRRQPPRRACCTPCMAVSTIARGRVASLDVAAAKAHPGVVEVMTPANRPPLAAGSGRQADAVQLPHRGAAERPGPLRQASRSRWSSPRRWRRRPKARACSRRATRPSRRGSGSTTA